jgi:tRNA-binding protein
MEPKEQSLPTITPDVFFRADIRVGKVLDAAPFPEARKPSIRITIDFGPMGIRGSSAQLTLRYKPEELIGKLVVAVVNFPVRRIAGFSSEVLVLGACPAEGDVILLSPDTDAPLGTRIA